MLEILFEDLSCLAVLKPAGLPTQAPRAIDSPAAQQAVLHYRTLGPLALGSGRPATRLEIELETGRMHQVRIQAASRGHPVLGDSLYGATTLFGPETPDPRARSIALHARTL